MDVARNTERPLPGLLNAVLDAAHQRHDNRKYLHPPSFAYSVFQWRAEESAGGSTRGSSTGDSAQPSAVPSGLGHSTAAGELHGCHSAYHSSLTLHHVPSASGAGAATQEEASHPSLNSSNGPGAPPTMQAFSAGPSNSGRPVLAQTATAGGSSNNSSGGASSSDGAGSGSLSSITTGGLAAGSSSLSGGGAGAVGSCMLRRGSSCCESVGGGADAANSSRASSRGPVRPAVVSRALTAWEGSELEVVCLYDSNFQTANQRGQHGPQHRVPAPVHIGPISYLYRWYCKRSTQFRGSPAPGDIPDAPAMPPRDEPWPAAAAAGGGAARARSAHSSGAGGATSPRLAPGAGSLATGSVASPASPRLQRSTSATAAKAGASAGSRAAAGGQDGHSAGSGLTSRRLNLCLDPVMSLSELVDMLEDLQVVPQLASRSDIAQLFKAARKAAEEADAAAVRAAAAAAATRAAAAPAGVAPPPPPPPAQTGTSPVGASARGSNSSNGSGARAAVAASPASPRGVKFAPGAAASPGKEKGIPSGRLLGHKPTKGATAAAAGSAVSGSTPPAGASPRSQQKSGVATPPSPFVIAKPPSIVFPPSADAISAAASDAACFSAGPSVTPRPQVHPEELRFPAFKDLLVRLAIAVACAGHSNNSSGSGGTGATAVRPPAGRGRSLSSEEAAAAVSQLLNHMGLHRSDTRGLKLRLDALARTAADHGARMAANQLLYLAGPTVVPPAAAVSVAAAAPSRSCLRPPPVAGGMPIPASTAHCGSPPWGILAAAPAPSYLVSVLKEEDRDDSDTYRPAWREFGAVALELGALAPGEWRQCRIELHNRSPHTLQVRVDGSGAPFCRVAHQGLASLPPGMPRHVDVTVQLPAGEAAPGQELLGELALCYSSSQDRREKEVVIPVYGVVSERRAGSPTTGRKVPTARAERGVMAAKATREPVAPEVALAAAAVAPLRHCGPRRSSSSCYEGSVSLTGSAASTVPLTARLSGGGGGGGTPSQGSARLAWESGATHGATGARGGRA